VKYDERGIPSASLRLGDSASVAGQDYDEGMPRQDIVPGDSRSAMGQTVASGMNNRGGAAPIPGPGDEGGHSQYSGNRGEQNHEAPNDGPRVGTDPRAVNEWQTKAEALLASCVNIESQGKKERQDWLFNAKKNWSGLTEDFHKMTIVDQGTCMPLLRSVNTKLDRLGVEQVGDGRPEEASQEPSGMNNHQEKGNVGEQGAPTRSTGLRDDQQDASNEGSSLRPREPPLSPSVRSTQERQSGRPPGPNQEKKGTWPTH
jgi:hypothetical protein